MFLGSMEIGQRLLRPEALSNGGRQWIGQDFFQHLRRSSDHFLDQMHGLMMELPNVLLQVSNSYRCYASKQIQLIKAQK